MVNNTVIYSNFDHHKFQKQMISKIYAPELLGQKTFFMTSRDNTVSYFLKIGTSLESHTLQESVNTTALKLLQHAVAEDYHYRYQLVTSILEDDIVLEILDELSNEINGIVKIIQYQRIETIPENNQFFKYDYLYPKNYFGASGIFIREKEAPEESFKEAAQLLLGQIIYTKPLVIKEEQLLDSVKEATKCHFIHKAVEKYGIKDITVIRNYMDKNYNLWLSKSVLLNQKIEFDYPDRKLTVKQFMDQAGIGLVRYISV